MYHVRDLEHGFGQHPTEDEDSRMEHNFPRYLEFAHVCPGVMMIMMLETEGRMKLVTYSIILAIKL